MKKVLAAVAASIAAVGVTAGAAFAGEVTGNGKLTPVNGGIAASICSFSGREDEAASPIQTQTPHAVWEGPIVGVVNPPPGTPGQACRGVPKHD